MQIKLPCYGIVIDLGPEDEYFPGAYEGGKITTELEGEEFDGIEALILAHAVAGVDVQSIPYIEGIETAVDAIFNHID